MPAPQNAPAAGVGGRLPPREQNVTREGHAGATLRRVRTGDWGYL
jgi:hypothetical protein